MRGGEAGPQREVTSVSRVPGFDDTASVHEASAPDVVADIRSGATVPDLDAPVLHSTVSPPQPPPGVKLGLLGGADRPPQPAAPESDFLATCRGLRELRSYFNFHARADIAHEFELAIKRVTDRIERMFDHFAAPGDYLANHPRDTIKADFTYLALQKRADKAEMQNNSDWAGSVRSALERITERTATELQALRTKYEIYIVPSTQAMQLPPATAPPTLTTDRSNWLSVYTQLHSLARLFGKLGWQPARSDPGTDFRKAVGNMKDIVDRRFKRVGGNIENVTPYSHGTDVTKQRYQALVGMLHQAEEADNTTRAGEIRQALTEIHDHSTNIRSKLTKKYGALENLYITMQPWPGHLPLATIAPTTSVALPMTIGPPVSVPPTTVPPVERLDILVSPLPIALARNPAFPEPAGGLVHTTRVPDPPPATVSGTTAAQPVAIETIVTPSLGGTSSFWLQPADPWPIRPPGMSGGPHPVAFVPWSAPPGPSSRAAYTEAIRTAVMSAGAPPGGQRAETPGFARAASGTVELPFSHRVAIARRFSTDGALFDAELTVLLRGADALGWSETQEQTVLDDLRRLHDAIVQSDSAAAVVDVDWNAIEALARILEAPPPLP